MLPFFKALITKILFCISLLGLAASAAAHTYFFAVTELSVNPSSNHIEVIHQITAHDIENTIAEIKQINFSPEHPHYDKYIQDYIEQHFSLVSNNQKVALNWIGFEVKRGQLFAYQESAKKKNLANLVVKNSILVDTYPKQINTVNFQDLSNTPPLQGSMTFNQTKRVTKIQQVTSN